MDFISKLKSNKLFNIMKNKKLTFSSIIINHLKPGDFIFFMIEPEKFSDMSAEDLESAFKKFEKKLPPDISYTLLPTIRSIVNTSNQDICKLFIDSTIKVYNEHFDDIYLPYEEWEDPV